MNDFVHFCAVFHGVTTVLVGCQGIAMFLCSAKVFWVVDTVLLVYSWGCQDIAMLIYSVLSDLACCYLIS